MPIRFEPVTHMSESCAASASSRSIKQTGQVVDIMAWVVKLGTRQSLVVVEWESDFNAMVNILVMKLVFYLLSKVDLRLKN